MLRRLPLLLLTLAVMCPAQKRWANAAEYDLFNRITAARDPARQIALLKQWESVYPKTEFQHERLLSFTLAYKRAGNISEAFTSAEQLSNLDPAGTAAQYAIVTLGPLLPAPTNAQIVATVAAARRLLSVKPVPAVSLWNPPPETSLTKDVEAERVSNLILEMRKAAPPLADPSPAQQRAVKAALDWAARESAKLNGSASAVR